MATQRIPKKCPICGADFTATTRKAVYCSVTCRREALRRRNAKAAKKYYNQTMGRMVS